MSKPTNLLGLLLITSCFGHASAADEWEFPGDVPVTEPVTVGTAGVRPPDVVRFLLAEGASSARLSPDGETVAFRWAVSGEPQLWTVATAGGFPRQLTFGGAITFYEWSPTGTELIVGRDAEGNEREGYYMLSPDGTRERPIVPLSDAFRRFGMFSSDGARILYSSTERNGRDFDIYLADVASGESRRVFQGTFGFFPEAWQPDGHLVIVSETRGEDANDVHLLNLESGVLTPLFTPAIAAAYEDFTWLPDGSGFFMATNVDREFNALVHYSLADQTQTVVAAPERDVDNIGLTADGRYLVWTENDDGYSRLRAWDRELERAVSPPAVSAGVYSVDVAGKESAATIRVSGPDTPGDVYHWDIAAGSMTRTVRASLGGLDPARFVVPESLRYAARDGVELQGLLYRPDPTEYADAPPVVVQVHGGPTGQSRPNFRPVEQYLVNNGIAVFAVNVRGSTGFGKTYARLDNQEKRLDSVRDLVDTVAFLSRDERLDTNKIAVMGGSYGGYMVNAVLGSYPGTFDAGVSIVGVSDWVRALREASPALKASDRIEYGDIREDRWQEFYAKNSPINNADKITVPLMVSHGVNDPRDPVGESDRLVRAVRANGHEVIYMRFPDEGHSIRKRTNRVAFYRTLSRFLDAQLKPTDELGD